MKKRNIMILVFMLVIGFAVVSTTLVINGTLNIGYNTEDFESGVIFTKAEIPNGKASIGETKKEITFETEKLESVGDKAILKYEIANISRNYDAKVIINCGLKENYESFNEYIEVNQNLESPFELISGNRKSGELTIELKKAYEKSLEERIEYVCTLVAIPEERTSIYIHEEIYKEEILNGADPVIKENLVPVTISDNGEVTYADTSKEWYNYENKEWANAVILVEKTSQEYVKGDIIQESDIESYFVWIPRYKYQIFDEGNYTTYIEGKPTESIAKEIQIEFESNSIEPSTGSKVNEWLTHPAFTNFDVNGFWVGKFETGYKGATTTEEAQVNEENPNKVIVKPNTYSWRGISVSNIFKTSYNYNRELDSHMMKNMEWGAVAYLSHSKYGINTEVRINNNSDFLTGYAATDETDQSDYPGEAGTEQNVTHSYNTPTGYKASTTGNITGVYDMSGGAWEYVAGYTPSPSDKSGFTLDEFTIYSKYLDLYSTNSSYISYNNRILGDATGEMGPFYYYADGDGRARYHNNWYDDGAFFIESVYSWFNRGGGITNGSFSSQFYFHRDTGMSNINSSFRLVLTSKI